MTVGLKLGVLKLEENFDGVPFSPPTLAGDVAAGDGGDFSRLLLLSLVV